MFFLLSEKTTRLGIIWFLSFISKLLLVNQIAQFFSVEEYEISLLESYYLLMYFQCQMEERCNKACQIIYFGIQVETVHHLILKPGLDRPDKTEAHYSISQGEPLQNLNIEYQRDFGFNSIFAKKSFFDFIDTIQSDYPFKHFKQ